MWRDGEDKELLHDFEGLASTLKDAITSMRSKLARVAVAGMPTPRDKLEAAERERRVLAFSLSSCELTPGEREEAERRLAWAEEEVARWRARTKR